MNTQLETHYECDGSGNILTVHSTGTGSSGGSVDVSYTFDNDGYVTLLNLSSSDLQSEYQITFANDIDNRGRLAATKLQTQNLGSLTAKFSYFGDTYNLESIEYADYEPGTDNDGSVSAVGLATFLTNYLPDSFDPTRGAFPHFVSGGSSYQIRYYENGARQATIINGQRFEGRTLEELRGNTVKAGSDSSTSWQDISCTYDENGYLTDRIVTAKENAEDIAQWVDLDYREETHISYTLISNPSKAVSIFSRLCG